jgi:hypothetical protein
MSKICAIPTCDHPVFDPTGKFFKDSDKYCCIIHRKEAVGNTENLAVFDFCRKNCGTRAVVDCDGYCEKHFQELRQDRGQRAPDNWGLPTSLITK